MTLKHTFLLFALSTSLALAAQNKTYLKIKEYFKATLAEQQAEIPAEFNKKKHDRQIVWKAWCDAVAEITTNTLPSPDSLANAKKHSWHLPDSLEPNATLNFYYGTKGNPPARSLPLFIYLHGSGPREREWATGLKICNNFDDSPSTYFIPQIPQEGQWYRWYQKSKQWAIERLLRLAMTQDNIDPCRIYLFGISEGGYGSQRLASYYADYLAAAGPMAGGEPLKNAPAENCGNIGFSLLTGDKDFGFYRNTLTTYTKQAFDSLSNKYPNLYRHNIELLKDMGHAINYNLTTPWLKTFSRTPYPSQFIWEDFEMDGRHRNGFYNIAVDKRPSTDNNTRTRYEYSITNNTIHLNISDIEYTCVEKDPNWGIEMKFSRSYKPSNSGKITIFLNFIMADLNKNVTVLINGKEVYNAKPRLTTAAMLKSLATFGDPMRIFPTAIEIEIPSQP